VSAPAVPLPDKLAVRAREIMDGRLEPVTARDSATVALLRDDPAGGLQVYMIRRARSMAFAAGAYAFPGGSVDARDRSLGEAPDGTWAGPSPAGWGTSLGVDPALAVELVCAAVRETFEEAGVLLAGPGPDTVTADVTDDGWEADRRGLVERTQSFADLLRRRRLVLRSDLLRPWAQWITPEAEERRFDTRFFVAALPAGQRARDVSGEADRVAWVRPADALRAARDGEIFMLPPTMVTLVELAAFDCVDAALAAPRRVRPRLPEVTLRDGRALLILPEELWPPDHEPGPDGHQAGPPGHESDAGPAGRGASGRP
jgi:8-oxo-dGTP pyrophosphatase MutT (NUDIX family)